MLSYHRRRCSPQEALLKLIVRPKQQFIADQWVLGASARRKTPQQAHTLRQLPHKRHSLLHRQRQQQHPLPRPFPQVPLLCRLVGLGRRAGPRSLTVVLHCCLRADVIKPGTMAKKVYIIFCECAGSIRTCCYAANSELPVQWRQGCSGCMPTTTAMLEAAVESCKQPPVCTSPYSVLSSNCCPCSHAPLLRATPTQSPAPPHPTDSMYGHIYKLAQAIKEGVDSVDGVEGVLYQVAETLPEDVLAKMHAAPKPDVPVVDPHTINEADGLAFGFPTR